MKKIAVFLAALWVFLAGVGTSIHARAQAKPPELGSVFLTVDEARAAMGFPGKGGMGGGKDLKVAIVDAGFAGLDEWLEKNPDMRSQIVRRTRMESKVSHGFEVLRVARLILPEVKFFLYEIDLSHKAFMSDLPVYIENMGRSGIQYANFSLGLDTNPFQDNNVAQLLDLFQKHNVFGIFAIGNSRGDYHRWTVPSLENGYMRVVGDDGSESLGVGFKPSKGRDRAVLYWQPQPGDPDIAVKLVQKVEDAQVTFQTIAVENGEAVARDGEGKEISRRKYQPGTLPFQLIDPPQPGKWFHAMFKVAKGDDLLVGRSMVVRVMGTRMFVKGGSNGWGSASAFALRDFPNVLTVGAFSRQKEKGRLTAADYSGYGVNLDGKAVPHVLGPGSLIMPEGDEIHGTSFAAPFVTAVLAGISWQSYNPKNVAERISSRSFLTANPMGVQGSRWGVPDAGILLSHAKRDKLLAPNVIADVSHRVEGDQLVFSGSLSRCCMEGVQAELVAFVGRMTERNGRKQAQGIKGAHGMMAFTTGAKDYDRLPVEIRIPMDAIRNGAVPGDELTVQFGVRSVADRAHPAGLSTPAPYFFRLSP